MRAFVAVILPDDAREWLERLQEEIPAGRLVPPENLHVTLAFLDEQPRALLADLDMALRGLTCQRFDFRFAGPGGFGKKRLRTLHADVEAGPELPDLCSQVRNAARAVGIDLRRKRFRPHVTLARFSRASPAPDRQRLAGFLARMPEEDLPAFTATRFALFRSTLHPQGPSYAALACYELV